MGAPFRFQMETNGMYDVTIPVAKAIPFHVGIKIYVFYETDTLRDIAVQFVQSRVKELFMVHPESQKLTGQLGVSEFLRFIFEGPECQDH